MPPLQIEFVDQVPPVNALILLCAKGDDPSSHPDIQRYDEHLDGHLIRLISQRHFRGRAGQRVGMHTLGRLPADQIWLIGTDKRSDAEAFLTLGQQLGGLGREHRWQSIGLQPLGPGLSPEYLEPLARGLVMGRYRFDRYQRAEEGTAPPGGWSTIFLVGPAPAEAPPNLDGFDALTSAIALVRDLVNEPAGSLTPAALGNRARDLAGSSALTVEILDAAACDTLGLGFLHAVSKGSQEPPVLIHLIHRPPGPANANARPGRPRVALVGKGITFDAGGLSLKTHTGLKDMKSDMAGGATVMGVMQAISAAKLDLEVHGIVPACENMPSGSAYHVGDILRGLDGPSVEVVNTDAEGRLILADGIAYAARQDPDIIIDLATLTGACVVALGPYTAGVMSNHAWLMETFLAAAARAGESVWQLPLLDNLSSLLKSQVADCKNAGGRWGGAITAGLFLQKFAKKHRWLHVDLAGPAFREKSSLGQPGGGTGFGVTSVVRFLERLVQTGVPEATAGADPNAPNDPIPPESSAVPDNAPAPVETASTSRRSS